MKEALVIVAALLYFGGMIFIRCTYLKNRKPNADLMIQLLNDIGKAPAWRSED